VLQKITEQEVLARLGAAAVLSVTITNSLRSHHQRNQLQQQGLNNIGSSQLKSDSNRLPLAFFRPIYNYNLINDDFI
jgi:hypothetical protein